MIIGFVGLGRMGFNMVLNLLDHKQKVVAYNRSSEKVKKIFKRGAIPAYSLQELVKKLPKRKIIWLMVTSKAVDAVLGDLIFLLSKGDIIIDGGNSFYKDSMRRYKKLKDHGIHFLDVGTSGGITGARHGACLMIGGDKKIFKKTEYIFKNLATKNGYGYMGESGAGHFVKMVHNGIEYGMMESIGEGFEAMYKYKSKFNFNLKEISRIYAHGSIISSNLINWLDNSLKEDKELKHVKGTVPHGETEEEMKHLDKLSEMPDLHQAILERVKSRKKPSFRAKVVASMRNQFGGHKLFRK